ncbi:laminin subunit beta-3 [Tyto alba]|uniref:laminin subunit beta-3 n=1 Tax=Tyto alba TaxID=56313 RepID=UPI001C66EFF0|nr:laminin subunit beta-3 [Tyto alba]XP_042655976.1 laminin subunit beta-3 [Tyto alba]XP_042655977.1 laminin subunit beta-3 [Tyto alba]
MESHCQLWSWALFLLLAAPRLPGAERACSPGACYPPARELLLGRARRLSASSTCGLAEPETYCTPHGEWSMKCCRCDSRLPHAYNSHRVENVLPSAGHSRWWQSRSGVERVSLQLDLDQPFQLSSVLLHFRSPLPAAMLIERSTDFGKTWEVYQYLASDCATSFPHVPRGSPESWPDTRCQALQGYPQHGGKVKFSVQDLASAITTSHSQAIGAELGRFTNLRINFTELPHIARQGYRSPSTFYAVTEMRVLGSCFCHGHADRCAASGELHAAQVHGHCLCQHNTAGPNCDRCAALYNDRPWAPAEDSDPHECQRCNCNGHSASCHFDPELYRASGGASGGVCDDCQHNTEGNNCERCKTNYFRNQRQDLAHPEVCLPCECDPDGTVPGSVCDPLTGRCVCKENVQGDRCHLCKPGFAQLANANPMGCHRCTCNALGTRQDVPCDDETGRCFCLPNVVGNDCDQCAAEHWAVGSGQGCRPCACHPRGSRSPHCNQFTGQCPCREGFTGRTCSAVQEQVCPDRHYGDVRAGCTECDCDFQGTEAVGCDKSTGQCLCRPGITGPRCDRCQRGHCSTYPGCELCHPCFRAYDGDIQRLRLRQAGLGNSTSQLPLGSGGSRFGPRLSQAESTVQEAQGILGRSSTTEQSLARAGSALAAVREQVQGINPDLHFLDETASLSRELEALNSSLLITNTQYQSKKTQFETSRSTDLSGAFKTIRSAYQTSTNASGLAASASGLLAESRESRRSTAGLEGGLAESTSKLLTLKGEIASSPNLAPVINKICGGSRAESCTPGRCEGLLCPPASGAACGAARPCHGIGPTASGALATATEAAGEIRSLSARLRETAELIKTTETSANQIQSNIRRLVDQMSVTRTQIEGDVRRIQQFIQQVRNFLSDRDMDPATIQEISESVLSLRLPTDAAAVLRKMTEIQNLATKLQCPESILAQTAEDIAKAKQLQQEAEQARNRANTVEGSVEDVVRNLRRANTVLLEARGAIRGSGSSLRFIQERVDEIQAVLSPAEKNAGAVGGQLDGLTARLWRLQRGAEQSRLRAADAQQTAGEAGEQARSAQQAFEQVKQMYAELKSRTGQSPALGEQGSRVQTIDLEAQALFEETLAMMLRMETLETEIQESNKALMSKSARLSGLEERVGRIRDAINKRVAYYESCS